MSNLDIGVACILLAAAILVFVFGVHADESDSAPHRTGLDQFMVRRDAIYLVVIVQLTAACKSF